MRAIYMILIALQAGQGISYNFNDPDAAHTQMAIKFDEQGQREDSLEAFRSAVRFGASSETYTNLGVCLMRLRRYYQAHHAMTRARELAVTEREHDHVKENWAALMQSMGVEGVSEPDPGARHLVGDDIGGGGGIFHDPVMSPYAPSATQSPDVQEVASKKTVKRRRKKRAGRSSGFPSRRYQRERLLHQRDVPFGVPMARVSVEDIDSLDPFFDVYRDRREPFILTGALQGWGALRDWPEAWQDTFPALWPNAVCDFYPYNMLAQDRQSPFLTRLPRAVLEVLIENHPDQRRMQVDALNPESGRLTDGSKFQYDAGAMQGRYMHLQLTPKMWRELEERGDILPPDERHWHLDNDDWLIDCLGYPDDKLAEEYHLKTHWKIILTGARGAGMFNHSDSLLTSSWHAHIMGSKWWYVCGKLTNGSQTCFEDYLLPGETLYYGHGWHHETQNLETPTMTITDTVAHAHNFDRISDQLWGTCAHEKHTFMFSAELCDALQVREWLAINSKVTEKLSGKMPAFF